MPTRDGQHIADAVVKRMIASVRAVERGRAPRIEAPQPPEVPRALTQPRRVTPSANTTNDVPDLGSSQMFPALDQTGLNFGNLIERGPMDTIQEEL